MGRIWTDAAEREIPTAASCISCSASLLLTLMFDIYSHLDTCYVMQKGLDHEGCGNSTENACQTLLYLVQQVNRTHLPLSRGLHISTDKSLRIDQRTAVSTIYFSRFAKPVVHILSKQQWQIQDFPDGGSKP